MNQKHKGTSHKRQPLTVKIVELNSENIKDVNRADNAFEVKSGIIPYIEGGEFRYDLEEVPGFYTKSYLDDELDYSTYIGNPEKIVYIAYLGDEIAGQIVLKRNWNKFALIEDIRVGSRYRRTGIGTKLIEEAVKWARKRRG